MNSPSCVYLDYAATTPVEPLVAARMAECLTATASFGNPGSTSHEYGEAASERVEAARAEVAATVGAQPAEVIWTSGATEANNLAIFGVAHYYRARSAGISSRCAPNTRRCSILAGNSSAADGG